MPYALSLNFVGPLRNEFAWMATMGQSSRDFQAYFFLTLRLAVRNHVISILLTRRFSDFVKLC